jgi:hypothetical protein
MAHFTLLPGVDLATIVGGGGIKPILVGLVGFVAIVGISLRYLLSGSAERSRNRLVIWLRSKVVMDGPDAWDYHPRQHLTDSQDETADEPFHLTRFKVL